MNKMLIAVLVASALLVAPMTSRASTLCEVLGEIAGHSAKMRGAGADADEAIAAFDAEFDVNAGGLEEESNNLRIIRSAGEAAVRQAYEEPPMSPDEEDAAMLARCRLGMKKENATDPEVP
jgi:hypothetical protein